MGGCVPHNCTPYCHHQPWVCKLHITSYLESILITRKYLVVSVSLISSTMKKKISRKTFPCVFIRYSSLHKGYRCLHPYTNKVFVSWLVVFDETVFPFKTTITPLQEPLSLTTFLEFDEWFSGPNRKKIDQAIEQKQAATFSVSSHILASICHIENGLIGSTQDCCWTTELENHAHSLGPTRSSPTNNKHGKNTLVHNFLDLSG